MPFFSKPKKSEEPKKEEQKKKRSLEDLKKELREAEAAEAAEKKKQEQKAQMEESEDILDFDEEENLIEANNNTSQKVAELVYKYYEETDMEQTFNLLDGIKNNLLFQLISPKEDGLNDDATQDILPE
jgi:hypothetical protein